MFILGGVTAALVRLLARRKVGLAIGGAADPYMHRRYVIPRNRFFNVYCHQILRDDDDRALHDHPWPNLSIVLTGGYREIMFVRRHRHGMPLPATIEAFRRPGSVVARRAATAHRLALARGADGRPVPAWTLFITGPVLRDWGFWCGGGRWVHWRLFTAGDRGELAGAGCGEPGESAVP